VAQLRIEENQRKAGKTKDHDEVSDAAIAECGTKDANYASSLSALAQLYRLRNAADFVKGNTAKTCKTLRDMAMKELT
jgi:hypothetical protein